MLKLFLVSSPSSSSFAVSPTGPVDNSPPIYRWDRGITNAPSPYVGAGLGVSAAILDAETIIVNSTGNSYYRQATTAANAAFTCQAFTGLRYRLNERMGLSVEYRYLSANSPEWDLGFHGPVQATLGFARIETHTFSLAFDYLF